MDLLRETNEGNRVFRITFPNGERVCFRLLAWEDFNKYWELSRKGTIPADIIEDSIFRQCCIDQVCIDRSHDMLAGIISTVVGLIMQMSGPVNLEGFNSDLDIARSTVDTLNSQVVMIICRAFPAYKPEDIGQMQWSDVLVRLAQAERILMKKVPPELAEPLRMLSPEEQETEIRKQGQIDVNQLIKDGRQDSAQMGMNPHTQSQLTEQDLEIAKEASRRQQRRAMARRLEQG